MLALACHVCGDTALLKFGTLDLVQGQDGVKRVQARAYCPTHTFGKPLPFVIMDSVEGRHELC